MEKKTNSQRDLWWVSIFLWPKLDHKRSMSSEHHLTIVWEDTIHFLNFCAYDKYQFFFPVLPLMLATILVRRYIFSLEIFLGLAQFWEIKFDQLNMVGLTGCRFEFRGANSEVNQRPHPHPNFCRDNEMKNVIVLPGLAPQDLLLPNPYNFKS